MDVGSWMAVWLTAWLAAGAAVPAGTTFEVRLKTRVASNSSRTGDPVEAVLIAPVAVGETTRVPAGAVLRGKVTGVQPVTPPEARAWLELDFSKLEDAAGRQVEIATRVVEVDNARETVENGRITGILASETLSARMDEGLARLEKRSSRWGGFLQVLKQVFLKEPEPEIICEPGVELRLETLKPLALSGSFDWAAARKPEPIQPEEELAWLVNAQPFQTVAESPPKPSDLTTLMFLGAEEQLQAAFHAAGWHTAAELDTASGLETFRAVAEMRGYKEAPVSTLLLDGKPPDLVFQKQNNTFAERHHLRIWKRPETFEGRTVWVSAATQDIGIEFSPENRTFIHKIDPQIDRERAKVVNDLVFTGRVAGLALIERPAAPRSSVNATGDKLETDGRMAVLLLE